MRFTTLATALTTAASLTSARIIGIAAPSTIAANTAFNLTLLTENYIQSVADISVAWGYTFTPYNSTVGSLVSSAYLGPAKSNTLENVTIPATAPAAFNGTSYLDKDIVLTAAVTSLYGASGGVVTYGFNVRVKVGEETSEELEVSEGSAWVQN